MLNTDLDTLRLMVKGAYDLQKIRIQMGLRLCANFRNKLKKPPVEGEESEEELSEEAESLIKQLKASYGRLTDGIAARRTIPEEKKFDPKGDALISTYSELVLVDQYVSIEKSEAKHFRQLEGTLTKLPIYNEYLCNVIGVGPAMAAVLITYLDPHKARHISSFWKYAGLDVAPDGAARSRRQEHLIEREYVDKDGNKKTRNGVTFNPFLRTKLLGVLASSFLRAGSNWRHSYDNYKHRIETDPARIKVPVSEWKKRRKEGEDIKNLWPPGRIHNAASRYMVKMFLADLWTHWRTLEGLPVTPTYEEARRGYAHGGQPPERLSKDGVQDRAA